MAEVALGYTDEQLKHRVRTAMRGRVEKAVGRHVDAIIDSLLGTEEDVEVKRARWKLRGAVKRVMETAADEVVTVVATLVAENNRYLTRQLLELGILPKEEVA